LSVVDKTPTGDGVREWASASSHGSAECRDARVRRAGRRLPQVDARRTSPGLTNPRPRFRPGRFDGQRDYSVRRATCQEASGSVGARNRSAPARARNGDGEKNRAARRAAAPGYT
jgi:hypothetical protein